VVNSHVNHYVWKKTYTQIINGIPEIDALLARHFNAKFHRVHFKPYIASAIIDIASTALKCVLLDKNITET
jgi:hypothetical protein